MNQKIRARIIGIFLLSTSWMESLIPDLMRDENQNEVVRTVHLMKDLGELVPEGTHGALRLSYKAIEAQSPWYARTLKYMGTNWIAIIGAVTGITGTVISLVALFKK